MLDAALHTAQRPMNDEGYKMRRMLEEQREKQYLDRAAASEKLSPILQVIQTGNPEDVLRAAALLKPLAIEILGR